MLRIFRASLLLTSAVALGGINLNLNAITCPLSCSGWGVDDWNTTRLQPGTPGYITSSTWLNNAIATSSFNNANWNFSFVDSGDMVSSSDFTNQIYSAWVVSNDAITGFNGQQYSRPVNGQDAGGADFEVGYSNNLYTDPLPGQVSFLQIYRQSINGGPYTYSVDNGGSLTNPFYVGSGGVGGVTVVNDNTIAWLLDIPFDCENGLSGPDEGNPCAGGADESRLSADVQFQVFLTLDTVNQGKHSVSIYGGETWGYLYTNSDDAAEPSLLLPGMVIIAAMLMVRRRIRRS